MAKQHTGPHAHAARSTRSRGSARRSRRSAFELPLASKLNRCRKMADAYGISPGASPLTVGLHVRPDERRVLVGAGDRRQVLVVGAGAVGRRAVARGGRSRDGSAVAPKQSPYAHSPIRAGRHARVGRVAEEAELLAVPRRHPAEREHARRRGAVAAAPLFERAHAVSSDAGRHRGAAGPPVDRVLRDLQRGRGRRRAST